MSPLLISRLPRRGGSIIAFLLLLLLLACDTGRGTGATDSGMSAVEMEVRPDRSPPPQHAPAAPAFEAAGAAARADVLAVQAVAPEGVPTMIIRTGGATVEVGSVEAGMEQVRALATQVGGYVASASLYTGQERWRHARLELKVPAEKWDEAVAGLSAIGRVIDVQVSAHDVGAEFVDLEARLENARRFEQRMLELLTRRTGNLEEVLAVERELARVREEIERYEGRLRHLRTQVAMSTLGVTMQEPRPLVGAYHGANIIGDAFRAAWRNFVSFVAGFIAALGVIVPVLFLAALLLAVGRWGWRRMRAA